jgi:hypothetical protein
VNQGKLIIDGSLARTTVTVTADGTLGGSGTITGTVTAAGTIAPGNSIGTLHTGATTLTGTYACEVGATESDTLAVTGDLTLTGATLSIQGEPTASSYTLATYSGTLTGTFNPVTVTGYTLNYGTGTNSQITLVKDGGYNSWADSFPGLTDKSQGGDPDGDGIKNLIEYVVGGDPRVSSTEFLPKPSFTATELVLSYKRSDASETDTTQTGQWSTNLTNWSSADVVIEKVAENGTDPDDMKIHIPLGKALDGKLFGRLEVTAP